MSTIVKVAEEDGFKPFAPGFEPPVGDALATAVSRRYLCIQVADCQPVLLVDPQRRAVANIHIGWRGSVGDIAGQTVGRCRHATACDEDGVIICEALVLRLSDERVSICHGPA